MSILDDLYAVMLAEVGDSQQAVPDLWKRYLTALGYTQSTVLGQMQAFAAANGMSIMAATNYVASGSAGGGATAPDAPTIGTATAGDTQATVTFTAPASDGGSAITGYTVTSSPGGLTGTGASSPITVTGLTNGVAYTFTVTATNAIGTSAASAASNSVTPAAANLISNGDFSNGITGWSPNNAQWTVAGGVASKTADAVSGTIGQAFDFEAATYEVTFTVNSVSGGNVQIRFIGGAVNTTGTNRSTPGTYTEQLVAQADQTTFLLFGSPATVCEVDNVIMTKVT